MKKIIHVPDDEEFILSTNVDFNKTEVKVFDDLPFEAKEVGILAKTQGKWFVKNKLNGVPIKFNSSNNVFFETLNQLFLIFSIEGYSAYTK
jgi:hypothetical protein